MKKVLKLLFIFIILILTSCGIDIRHDNPDVIFPNENCEIYIDGKLIANVEYNSTSVSELDDTNILVKYILIISPINSLKLTSNDFLLRIGYESFELRNYYYTSIEYNIKVNGYDIFENNLDKSVTYEFNFIALKEKNNQSYNNVGIELFIFDMYFLN